MNGLPRGRNGFPDAVGSRVTAGGGLASDFRQSVRAALVQVRSYKHA